MCVHMGVGGRRWACAWWPHEGAGLARRLGRMQIRKPEFEAVRCRSGSRARGSGGRSASGTGLRLKLACRWCGRSRRPDRIVLVAHMYGDAGAVHVVPMLSPPGLYIDPGRIGIRHLNSAQCLAPPDPRMHGDMGLSPFCGQCCKKFQPQSMLGEKIGGPGKNCCAPRKNSCNAG